VGAVDANRPTAATFRGEQRYIARRCLRSRPQTASPISCLPPRPTLQPSFVTIHPPLTRSGSTADVAGVSDRSHACGR
jgi:hypothetical protein